MIRFIEESELDEVLKLPQRTRGWNGRRDLPCEVEINGGCRLHVVPAWLWQARPKPRALRFDSTAIPMRRVR